MGIKRPHHRLFDDIDWSTERVAAQTLARAAEIGLPMCLLTTWYDVDDYDALRVLYSELFEGASFAAGLQPYPALNTTSLIRRLIAEADLLERLNVARDGGLPSRGPALDPSSAGDGRVGIARNKSAAPARVGGANISPVP